MEPGPQLEQCLHGRRCVLGAERLAGGGCAVAALISGGAAANQRESHIFVCVSREREKEKGGPPGVARRLGFGEDSLDGLLSGPVSGTVSPAGGASACPLLAWSARSLPGDRHGKPQRLPPKQRRVEGRSAARRRRRVRVGGRQRANTGGSRPPWVSYTELPKRRRCIHNLKRFQRCVLLLSVTCVLLSVTIVRNGGAGGTCRFVATLARGLDRQPCFGPFFPTRPAFCVVQGA